MHFHRWQIIRLLLIGLIGVILIGMEWQKAHPTRLPLVEAEEMAKRVPDFRLGLPALKPSEINEAFIKEAVEDALRSSFECTYWKAVFCPESRCYVYVLNTTHYTDTHILYRTGGENKRLLEKCKWNTFQNWPLTTQADRDALKRKLLGAEVK